MSQKEKKIEHIEKEGSGRREMVGDRIKKGKRERWD